MAEMKIAIGVEGLDEIRALTAALEQYNQNSLQQTEALRAELDRARVVAAADLETLRSRDNQIDQMAADLAKLTSRASIAEAASREKDKKLAEAHDRIHQLEQTHDQQVGALTAARNNVDAFQRDLARTQADTSQAIQMLQGKRSATLTTNEVGAMLLREVSAVMRALEANSVTIRNLQEDHLVKNVGAEKLREDVARLEADLRKEQKIKDFVNDECQKIRAAFGLGRMAQAPEVLAAIDALQVDVNMKQHMIEGLRGRAYDLEQTIAKAAPVESDKKLAGSLKMRLAEANDRIRHMTDVIKELHKQYHELEARKMATQYDLDRANDEIAAAEAEIAKYKPLIEAVRAGAVFAWRGQWVQLRGFETEQTTGDSLELITLTGTYYAGVIQCL